MNEDDEADTGILSFGAKWVRRPVQTEAEPQFNTYDRYTSKTKLKQNAI